MVNINISRPFNTNTNFYLLIVIIKNGGAKANIIPDFAELELIIRAETDADLKVLKDKLYNNFHAAASATGCSVSYSRLWVFSYAQYLLF